ncbi:MULTISPECIES: type IV-A pilus assembly ATPase PilB [Acidithiobacillus]|jgi:type IV pilus assembly protein PilB|uniref:Type IV fimbrial assembly, ATPase PilB n=3 Tax=Acidithiobacillus caldus TaxID=33059 RepID=F9ZU05_ACICS|nr:MULTISPECIES: type IV-A pilus assembly ATPase PilB [Acidithiobacillus]AEK59505.1 Type IV fimbrial assembly, ATPase PilB [Acidithiobacillus caldus SM-1]AIA56548.1 Type IV fimbrial assembly, ATPase PilB [Acidithiobacillus caldus ATCC 51756]MBU2729435.1 type IV-A pilus assembly ATPase PilB [Acidithiobacillus caldus]MBU2735601.1 type IV-A pilus assembly ATPase PilB [Acidithiobacillus caldus ATCC 51756]MBU2745556.1 type IV-A pilus assembly ATPase PilB [Acidithiobacillus caldus]
MALSPDTLTLNPMLRALAAQGLGDEATLRELANDPKRGNRPLLFHLVDKGAVKASALMAYLSNRYNVPMLDLEAVQIDDTVVAKVDRQLMARHQVLPLSRHRDTLFLAVADPTDFKAIEEIKFNTGLQVTPILVEADKLSKAVAAVTSSMQGKLEDLFVDDGKKSGESDEFDLGRDAEGVDDAPVVRFVQQLLLDAIQKGVSDIHLEPYERDIRVRYRLDGVLQDVLHPPIALREGVTSRLKILCKLDISERRLPQDGRLRVRVPPARIIDFRVSFLPTNFGETIVLRLLDPASSKVPIEALGFLPEQRKAFEDAIHRPYGMILVTGPTGSGKTTTLYTALNILNTGDVNISTAEDPVEIPVYGINQVNINERIGLNFAAALRSFLRQDPDIIMVGEVRDLETAETAIKAAQTGHLVLATLHTNDAPQSLTRLENMGIPTYNIAGAVHLVMAQRLARKLCPVCKTPLKIPEQALLEAGFAVDDLQGWRPLGPKGCDECNQTGYKGRIGLYQVMPVSDAMRDIIMRGGTSMDLARQAQTEGVLSMRQAGLQRVREGLTSLEEVLRVTNL